MNQNQNARAMMGFCGWGPVGGTIVASKTTASTSRIQYASQFGPTIPAALTFTSSTVALSATIYGMDYSPALNIITAASYNIATASTVQYSYNGTTWNTGTLATSSACAMVAVNWIPQLGKFFMGGSNNSATSATIASSTDGINFTVINNVTSLTPVGGVAYGNGVLVAQLQPSSMSLQSNAFLYSTNNGSTWATASTPTNGWNAGNGPYGVFYIPSSGIFMTVGSTTTTAYAATSSNGTTWTVGTPTGLVPSASGALNLYKGMAWSPSLGANKKGRVVIAWFSGANATKPSQYSDDGGYTWNNGSTMTSAIYGWYSIIWEPYSEQFWVVDSGSSKTYGSKDGINWTSYTSAAAGNSISYLPQYQPPLR